MTIGEAVDTGERLLAAAGVDSPRLEAELLLGRVLGRKPLALRLAATEPAPPEPVERYLTLARERATRRPLAYVTGVQEFMGLTVDITPAVLIPRPDTEVLVETALRYAREAPEDPVVVEVGTGSGVIALYLAQALPHARVFATDVSAAALDVARANAARTGLPPHRITFLQGDLLAPLASLRLENSVHVFVANLPYIPSDTIPTLMPEVSRFEPRVALDGGPDGLALIRRFLRDVPQFLHPTGFVALEIGWDQAEPVQALLADADWVRQVEVIKDLEGRDRVVVAQKKG